MGGGGGQGSNRSGGGGEAKFLCTKNDPTKNSLFVNFTFSNYRGGGGELRGGIISPWDISQWVYFACNLEFAVGNFAPTCCEPTFGWCWLWTRLLSIIFHPCKECSKLQAKFASVPCVQQ